MHLLGVQYIPIQNTNGHNLNGPDLAAAINRLNEETCGKGFCCPHSSCDKVCYGRLGLYSHWGKNHPKTLLTYYKLNGIYRENMKNV